MGSFPVQAHEAMFPRLAGPTHCVRIAVAILLLTIAVACGGGGGATTPSPSPGPGPGSGASEAYGSGYYDPSTHADPASTITVTSVAELEATIQSTKVGSRTVLIADGVYHLTRSLFLTGNDLTYRSLSGNRDAVVLDGGMDASGNGGQGFIFQVTGNHFRLQDLSLGKVYYHGIQILGETPGGADHLHVKNVRFFDIKEQMIKGSVSDSTPTEHADAGVVEGCLFEYTQGKAFQYYCGGIDVHRGANWIVRDNTFRHIKNPGGTLTEGAVHFWNQAAGTIVERNRIEDCDRGIMFGLDNSPHSGGIIRNNFVQAVQDTGIYLCFATDPKVYNNTVYLTSGYANAIEYRFAQTSGVSILNNLCNAAIQSRDGGSGIVQNNVTNAQAAWFANAPGGDLHLVQNPATVVNKALDLAEVKLDVDRQSRPAGQGDIGADELP